MKLLLDTHIWLWLNLEPDRIPGPFATAIADINNTLIVSVASAWETGIKQRLGKLEVGGPFLPFLDRALEGMEVLDIRLSHVQRVYGLPPIHRDPFDRVIIAQALCEELTLLTVDPVFPEYGVSVLA